MLSIKYKYSVYVLSISIIIVGALLAFAAAAFGSYVVYKLCTSSETRQRLRTQGGVIKQALADFTQQTLATVSYAILICKASTLTSHAIIMIFWKKMHEQWSSRNDSLLLGTNILYLFFSLNLQNDVLLQIVNTPKKTSFLCIRNCPLELCCSKLQSKHSYIVFLVHRNNDLI